jgi:transposase-like protein
VNAVDEIVLSLYAKVLTNRAVDDFVLVVWDGLKGLPEVVTTSGPRRSCRPR